MRLCCWRQCFVDFSFMHSVAALQRNSRIARRGYCVLELHTSLILIGISLVPLCGEPVRTDAGFDTLTAPGNSPDSAAQFVRKQCEKRSRGAEHQAKPR